MLSESTRLDPILLKFQDPTTLQTSVVENEEEQYHCFWLVETFELDDSADYYNTQ